MYKLFVGIKELYINNVQIFKIRIKSVISGIRKLESMGRLHIVRRSANCFSICPGESGSVMSSVLLYLTSGLLFKYPDFFMVPLLLCGIFDIHLHNFEYW